MSNKYEKTFCNPISLPDYAYAGKDWGFLSEFLPVTGRWAGHDAKFDAPVRSYRSLSDPDVMFYDGKWYLYASADCCYSSADMVNWERHDIIPHRFCAEGLTKEGRELTAHEKRLYEIGVALTAVPFRGKIYMTHSSTNAIWVSDTPYGPFEKVGAFERPDGSELWVDDPSLFEDNGRLYMYFGCGIETGIQGVELDPDAPNKLLCDPVRIVEFRPETGWECTGARYQDKSLGWIEGCDMFKANGRYYLTYAANGTTFDTYNLGVYYSDESPLSGFRPQKNGPFCEKRMGICKGAGHGCVTEGPNGSIWVFYTSVAAYTHMFERRLGMDKVIIDENGELTVQTTDAPQWAPGITAANDKNNAAGIFALTHQNPAWASSCAPGRDPFYATDESMITWWQPDNGDTIRRLVVDLRNDYSVCASRVLWKESGLDEDKGILPGAIKYKVEVASAIDSEDWVTVLDMSENDTDYLNDYRTFPSASGSVARLTILDTPKGLDIGVISFTVFGTRN
mgnify:FL=1